MNKKRKRKENRRSLQITPKGTGLSDAHKEEPYKVLRINLTDGRTKKTCLHGAMASGIKSYEAHYKEGFVTRPLGKGLTFVSNLLLKSGISMLHDLGNDIKGTEKL